MKVNSITTEVLSTDRQVISVSKTVFKKGYQPFTENTSRLFFKFEDVIKEHMKYDGVCFVSVYVVTIRTSKGRFIQTYKPGAIK